MNQYDISNALSRRLELNQYSVDYNDGFWSEEISFSFFVGCDDNNHSFQVTISYF